MTGKAIQTYECRLRKARVLRLADVGGVTRIGCCDELVLAAQAAMRDLPHEQVWLFLLNGRNDVQGAIRIGEGGLHGCALRPVDVLRPAMLAGASAVALAHNHPSGDATPSAADVEMTRTLKEACELVGIYLLDHVIVTANPNVFTSMFRSLENW